MRILSFVVYTNLMLGFFLDFVNADRQAVVCYVVAIVLKLIILEYKIDGHIETEKAILKILIDKVAR